MSLSEIRGERRQFDPNLVNTSEFEDFFENGAVALHLVGGDGRILRANRAELDMLGYAADEYVGRPIADFHADSDAIADILDRLKRGEKLDKYPARLRCKDGSVRHVLITSSVRFQNGEFLHTRCFTIDVTEVKAAQDRLRDSEERLRQVLEALPAAVYTTDAAGRITYFNPAAVELAGRVPELGKDEWCVTWRLRTPDGALLPHDQCPMAIALKENRPIRGVEAFAERPDGKLIPFLPFPTPLQDSAGRPNGAVNMLVDLSDRKEAERRQALLIRELHHRVKNTLATVQAIMGSTIRNCSSMEDFQKSFITRIAALTKTHSLLTDHDTQSVRFSDLLRNELGAYDGGERVTLDGSPVVEIPAHLAVSIGMAIHELTTNAAKYGAFSSLGGSLAVRWEMKGDTLDFTWREKNLAAIAPPHHQGFGSQLIKRVLPQQMGAEVKMEFLPDGLHVRIAIPTDRQH